MANIRENKKGGKVVSYRFIVCLGRDAEGKQIRSYTTWRPPVGMMPAKARKEAERQAALWEDQKKASRGCETPPPATVPKARMT